MFEVGKTLLMDSFGSVFSESFGLFKKRITFVNIV